jgi:F-type H+-transporting ATPase subunit b
MSRIVAMLLMLGAFALALSAAPTPAFAAGPEAAHTDGDAAKTEPSLLRGPKESLITAVTTIIVFVALLAILGKYAWGPIASGLQAREDKIRKDIADAEAARTRAEQTLKEYSTKLAAAEAQIRDMLAKAQSDAEGVAAGIKVKAQQDSEEIKERATK